MSTSPTLMVVVTQPAHPLTEDNYNAWYSDNHLPYVLLSSGFPSASRFRQQRVIKGQMTPYIAFYQADHDTAESAQAAYAAISREGIGDRWNESHGNSLEVAWWAYYNRIMENGQPEPADPPGAVLVTLAQPDGGRGKTGIFLSEELENWYQQFMHDLATVDAVRGSTLYRLDLAAGGDTPSRYLSVHELATDADGIDTLHADLMQACKNGSANHDEAILPGGAVTLDCWAYYTHITTHHAASEEELLSRRDG